MIRTWAELKTLMPTSVEGGISADDIHDFVDTVEGHTLADHVGQAGSVKILHINADASAFTAKTDIDTADGTIYAWTMPAGTMGPNDAIRITARPSFTNSAVSKQLRIRFGNALVHNPIMTTGTNTFVQTLTMNRNSLTQQLHGNGSVSGFGVSGQLYTNSTDTSGDVTITFEGVFSVAGSGAESITLQSVMIELIKAP